MSVIQMYQYSSKWFPRITSYLSEKFWKLFIIIHMKAFYKHLSILGQLKYNVSFNQLYCQVGHTHGRQARVSCCLFFFFLLYSFSMFLSLLSSLFFCFYCFGSLLLVLSGYTKIPSYSWRIKVLWDGSWKGEIKPDLINSLQDTPAVNNSIISQEHTSNFHTF